MSSRSGGRNDAKRRARDLLTTPYVFNEARCEGDRACPAADIVVCHLGPDTGGAIRAATAPLNSKLVLLPVSTPGQQRPWRSTEKFYSCPWRPDPRPG